MQIYVSVSLQLTVDISEKNNKTTIYFKAIKNPNKSYNCIKYGDLLHI